MNQYQETSQGTLEFWEDSLLGWLGVPPACPEQSFRGAAWSGAGKRLRPGEIDIILVFTESHVLSISKRGEVGTHDTYHNQGGWYREVGGGARWEMGGGGGEEG